MKNAIKVTWVFLDFLTLYCEYFQEIKRNPCDLSCNLKYFLSKSDFYTWQKKSKISTCPQAAIMDFWDPKFWDSEFFTIVYQISKNEGKQNFILTKLSKTTWFLENVALNDVIAVLTSKERKKSNVHTHF